MRVKSYILHGDAFSNNGVQLTEMREGAANMEFDLQRIRISAANIVREFHKHHGLYLFQGKSSGSPFGWQLAVSFWHPVKPRSLIQISLPGLLRGF